MRAASDAAVVLAVLTILFVFTLWRVMTLLPG